MILRVECIPINERWLINYWKNSTNFNQAQLLLARRLSWIKSSSENYEERKYQNYIAVVVNNLKA